MDIKDYFEIISTDNKVLHARMKHFWTEKVVAAIGRESVEVFKKVVEIIPKVTAKMGVDQAAEKVEKTQFRIAAEDMNEAQQIVGKVKSELANL